MSARRFVRVGAQLAEHSRVASALVALLALALLLGACSRTESSRESSASGAASATPLPVIHASLTDGGGTGVGAAPVVSYADVVSRVAPAVVTINVQSRAHAPQQYPFTDDPSFRDFFGEQGPPRPPAERRERGLGSGVIVSNDGFILTNHHVIDGAEQIRVALNDNRLFDARVVGSDPPSDLAVLKIDAGNLPLLTLGDSDGVRVGDVVLAVGNPLGIGQTVTEGIISAKGRQTGLSNGSFEDFLQTDASINQGNSGGALVNMSAELVGINSQILSPSGGSIGIGFAIPSNMARSVMEELKRTGKVRRGQLGVVVQELNSETAASLGIRETKGVVVSQVQPGSAADRAGIRKGDVITALNGVEVSDPNTFRNQVASTPPGTEVTLTIRREGREQQVRATLGEFTPQAEQRR
jgi:Do/DeqQ family serine protease